MATIKDIAKAANVSHGTVSNVLNKKGNVSAKKTELVERIALEMGYNINRHAKSLRLGKSRNIDIVIPDNGIRRYRDLYKSLSKYLAKAGYTYNLHISEGVPHKEKEIIKGILSDRTHSIVIISCLDRSDRFYRTIKFNDSNLIFIERKVVYRQGEASFYSYSAEGIGKNLVSYIRGKKFGNIAYFSDRKNHSFENDIFQVLSEQLSGKECSLSQFSSDTSLDIQISFEIMLSENRYDAIITTSKEKASTIRSVIDLSGLGATTEIITIASTGILKNSPFTEYELNYKLLGRIISQNINNDQEKTDYILDAPDFHVEKSSAKTPDRQINIACIQGKSEDALRYVSRLIYASEGIRVNIFSYEYSVLFNMIRNNSLDDDIDLIRIDMEWLTTFGKKIFIPIKEAGYDFSSIFSSFIDDIEDEYSRIDGVRYAFPFDPSMLLLFYRSDLFNDAVLSRVYFEKFRTELHAPASFREYNQIASFFSQRTNEKAATSFGTTCTINSPQSIACQFLPIYYSLGGVISNTEKPHFSYELLKESIEIYLEGFKYTRVSADSFWGDSASLFASGESAMCITFSNRTSTLINSKVSKVMGIYNFKTLPGQKQIIGGGVLGISRKSRNIPAVCDFLDVFYSKKISTIFAYLCGASASRYVYENEDIADVYPWMNYVQENLKNGKRRFSCMNFNELDFEYNLGISLKKLVNEESSIDECIFNIMNVQSRHPWNPEK